MSDETVTACPECDSTRLRRRSGDARGVSDKQRWRCSDCGAAFRDGVTRSRHGHGNGGDFSPAGRALRDADPSDVGGGR